MKEKKRFLTDSVENVGVICEVGDKVTGFSIGDRVGVGIFRNFCGMPFCPVTRARFDGLTRM